MQGLDTKKFILPCWYQKEIIAFLFLLNSHRTMLHPPRPAAAPPHIPPASTTVWSGTGGLILKREKRRLEIECEPLVLPLAIPKVRSYAREENLSLHVAPTGTRTRGFVRLSPFALLER